MRGMGKYRARNVRILESAFSPLRWLLSPHFVINILAERAGEKGQPCITQSFAKAHLFEFWPSPSLTASTYFHCLRFLLHCLAEMIKWRRVGEELPNSLVCLKKTEVLYYSSMLNHKQFCRVNSESNCFYIIYLGYLISIKFCFYLVVIFSNCASGFYGYQGAVRGRWFIFITSIEWNMTIFWHSQNAD